MMKFSANQWVGGIGLLLVIVMCGVIAYMLVHYDEIQNQQIEIVRDYMNSRSETLR